MGNVSGKGKDRESLETTGRAGGPGDVPRGGAGSDPASKGNRRRSGKNIRNDSITRLPDGTICIGTACGSIKLDPKTGPEIDLRDCDDELREDFVRSIAKGPTLYRITPDED